MRIVSDLLDKKTKSRPPYKNPGPREARQRLSTAFNFFQTLSTSESTPSAYCYMQPWLDFSNSFDEYVPKQFQRTHPRRLQQEKVYRYLLEEYRSDNSLNISTFLHDSCEKLLKEGQHPEAFFIDKTHVSISGAAYIAKLIVDDIFGNNSAD